MRLFDSVSAASRAICASASRDPTAPAWPLAAAVDLDNSNRSGAAPLTALSSTWADTEPLAVVPELALVTSVAAPARRSL
jgi:hypothetical protein